MYVIAEYPLSYMFECRIHTCSNTHYYYFSNTIQVPLPLLKSEQTPVVVESKETIVSFVGKILSNRRDVVRTVQELSLIHI